MKRSTLFISILFMAFIGYGQVSISVNNMESSTTGAISSGNPIVITSGQNIQLQFAVELSKPYNQVVNGDLYVYIKQSSSSTPSGIGGSENIANSSWSGSSGTVYYNTSKSVTLYSSDFNTTGGTLYVEFESTGGVKYTSSAWDVSITTPAITNNTISQNQSIYSGQTPQTISGSTPSGGNGTYSYSWKRKTTGNWSTISGATGKNHSPGNLTTTTSHKRIVTSGTSTSESNVVVITVSNPPISNNTISGTQTIDEGSIPNALVGSTPTGGNGSYSYLWQKKTTGSWSNISGATSKNYSPPALVTTTQYRRRVSSSGVSNSYSAPVTITVINYPPITFNTIAFDGVNKVIGSVPEGGNGSYLYEYFIGVQVDNGLEHWSGFSTNKDFNIPPFFLGLSQHFTVWIERTVKSVNKTSVSHWIIIEPGIPDIGNNLISFNGSSLISGSTPIGGIGSYSYSWEFWFEDGAAIPISGATGKNLTVPGYILSLETRFIRRIVYSGSKISTSEWENLDDPSGSKLIFREAYFDPSEESLESNYSVYPNPSTGSLTFNVIGEKEVRIFLISPVGQIIEMFKGIPNNSVQLEIPSHLSEGIYHYKIVTDGAVKTGKILYIKK